jgi:hypothetical protein
MGVGTFKYAIAFATADGGQSLLGPSFTISTTTGNQKVHLASISTGPTGTTARNIYRTVAGGSAYLFVATINDNTTTTYTDTTNDAGLGANQPTHSSFGGTLYCIDGSGSINGIFYQDGVIYTTGILLNTLAPYISSAPGYIGFKAVDGTKLAEITGTGNLIIAGTFIGTTGGSNPTLANGKTFDGFDVAEIYPTDADYPAGTVVCPGPNGLMVKCTHDNCFAASITSASPGLALGEETPNNKLVAVCGRVNVKTAVDMHYRTLVVSDGRGGVRPLQAGEVGFVMGFTLNATDKGMIGLMIRPYVVLLK